MSQKIDDLIAAGENAGETPTVHYNGEWKSPTLDEDDHAFYIAAANAREDIKALREENKRLRELLKRASFIVADKAAGGKMITSKEYANDVYKLIQQALGDKRDDQAI